MDAKVDKFIAEQRRTNEDFRRSIGAIRKGVERLEQVQADRVDPPLTARPRAHG